MNASLRAALVLFLIAVLAMPINWLIGWALWWSCSPPTDHLEFVFSFLPGALLGAGFLVLSVAALAES